MQTLAVQITVFFLVLLVLCFVWVLRQSGRISLESVAPAAYRLRRRLFVLSLAAGVGVSAFSLLPWPHEALASQVSRSIDVKARQWAWTLSDDKALVGEVIEFRVTSEDVNHSFALYNERRQALVQVQAMPGFMNKVRHRFTEPGTYQILCLEYCGLAHHGMVAQFQVEAAP